MEPNPFKKEERFRPQSEMRLIFVARGGQAGPKDRPIFAFPDPTAHFELTIRDRSCSIKGGATK